MRVDLDYDYKNTLQAIKCCGSVSCHCLLPCGSQLRCENSGGMGGLENTGGASRLPEHGRMVRWIQLSCKIKGREMWFPIARLTTHQLHHSEWSPHLSKLHFLRLLDADHYASSRGGGGCKAKRNNVHRALSTVLDL